MDFIGVCLITKDVPALAKFYSDIFGVESEGNEIHAELEIGGIDMAIFSDNSMESMVPNSMKGAGYGSFTLNFKVKDVDEEYDRLKSLKVEFIKPPTTHSWGARSMWFRDPDGNIINFVTILKNK